MVNTAFSGCRLARRSQLERNRLDSIYPQVRYLDTSLRTISVRWQTARTTMFLAENVYARPSPPCAGGPYPRGVYAGAVNQNGDQFGGSYPALFFVKTSTRLTAIETSRG